MGRPAVNGPRHYLEAVPDSARQFTAEAQVHATLALAAATALAIDPTPEAVAVWDPLVLEGKDGEPLVDARIVCGAPLNPGAGIECIRYEGGDEHADGFHDDGRGNRWSV